MPIPLGGNFYPFTQITGRNFYQISLRARQGAPHTRTGMQVNELKEEMEQARSEATSGNKSWLRRRLHAAIVREYLEVATWRTSELTGVSHSRRRIFRAS